ncbi:MAG TPA: fibronectin type III domain-containing protein, partial [Candidatus Manganitrophaceae bacterium]|nr:fibronectin type III domain-containing protein [Candidatus Manganitrophaceae bacterium]
MPIRSLFLFFVILLTGCNPVPHDATAPSISEIHSEKITLHSATITWGTDEMADGRIEYGTTAAYGSSTPLSAPKGRAHSQSIIGLEPGTLYHYRVLSRDAEGNLAASPDQT